MAHINDNVGPTHQPLRSAALLGGVFLALAVALAPAASSASPLSSVQPSTVPGHPQGFTDPASTVIPVDFGPTYSVTAMLDNRAAYKLHQWVLLPGRSEAG